jgi:pSer/pThr/pTyr-binding forkhead associated (FHA) protein
MEFYVILRLEVQTGDEGLRYRDVWILQSSEPDSQPLTFRLAPGAVKTVGRAPRADFIVDAALVSRVHCRLSAGDDTLEVVDLSSTNGTFVNDKRVQRAALASGDRLRVGRVELKIDRRPEDLHHSSRGAGL